MLANRPLWRCTRCGRRFANRNQSHACGRHTLASHFAGKPAAIRSIYDVFVSSLRRIGPVKVLAEKTRIAFQVRMSFAQLTTRTGWVDGHLVLARRVRDRRFRRVDTISARNHVHHFRLETPADVDAALVRWMREAYRVGQQRHLRR